MQDSPASQQPASSPTRATKGWPSHYCKSTTAPLQDVCRHKVLAGLLMRGERKPLVTQATFCPEKLPETSMTLVNLPTTGSQRHSQWLQPIRGQDWFSTSSFTRRGGAGRGETPLVLLRMPRFYPECPLQTSRHKSLDFFLGRTLRSAR